MPQHPEGVRYLEYHSRHSEGHSGQPTSKVTLGRRLYQEAEAVNVAIRPIQQNQVDHVGEFGHEGQLKGGTVALARPLV